MAFVQVAVSFAKSLAMKYQNSSRLRRGRRGGKPCVRGLRITVYEVLNMLANRMSHAEILKDFPDLTEQDILAALRMPPTGSAKPNSSWCESSSVFLIKSQ